MLINLARAHERGGELDAAVKDLERLLAEHPGTEYELEAEQRLGILRAKLAEQPAQPPPVAAPAPEPEPAPGAPARRPFWPPSWPTLAVGGGALAVAVAALGTGLRGARHLP